MKLLARYHLDRDSRLSLDLLDIETGEAVNIVTRQDAPDSPLIAAAKAWAADHGQEIAAIDDQVLR